MLLMSMNCNTNTIEPPHSQVHVNTTRIFINSPFINIYIKISSINGISSHHYTPTRSIYSNPTEIAVNAQSMNPAFVSRIFWLNSLLVG
jgi:hypothetical protein